MSMAGHGMGGRWPVRGVMRSMRRDDSVTQQHVTKGTARRMIQFARPYRAILGMVPGAGHRRGLHRDRQPAPLPLDHQQAASRSTNKRLIIGLSLVAALRGRRRHRPLHRDPLGLGARSARASSTTCARRCSPTSSGCRIAFFTRTQTGALISRLNNDVIGAQQAFTDTLSSVVSQPHQRDPRPRS